MRLGRFTIPSHTVRFQQELARRILRDMIVVRAESMFAMDAIEYVAMHPSFREIDRGSLPINYTAEITDDIVVWREMA